MGQGYHGGIPPTLDDIECDSDLMNKFVTMWIGSHKGLDLGIKRYLVANMLRHWDETISLIQKEPRGVYSGEKYRRHIFIHKVFELCNHLQITEETFISWVRDVRHGFIKRNAISMSQEILKQIGYQDVSIDSRSFLEKMECISTQ